MNGAPTTISVRDAIVAANIGWYGYLAAVAPPEAIALKYADAIEPARWVTNASDLADIIGETGGAFIAWRRPLPGGE